MPVYCSQLKLSIVESILAKYLIFSQETFGENKEAEMMTGSFSSSRSFSILIYFSQIYSEARNSQTERLFLRVPFA